MNFYQEKKRRYEMLALFPYLRGPSIAAASAMASASPLVAKATSGPAGSCKVELLVPLVLPPLRQRRLGAVGLDGAGRVEPSATSSLKNHDLNKST